MFFLVILTNFSTGRIIIDQGICAIVIISDAFGSRKDRDRTIPIDIFANVLAVITLSFHQN